jgi:type I restriction-modification system DNA methylase subunit
MQLSQKHPKPEKVEPFSHYLEILARTHGRPEVFDDFLTLVICVFSMKRKEDEYFRIFHQYTNDEFKNFSKALGSLVIEMDRHQFEDPFADYFQEAISKGHNSQYFTPDCVGTLMSAITMQNAIASDNKIYDSACGSGGLLLAAAKKDRTAYFIGCDISEMCCKMAVINLCLNSLRGEVWHMNTLSLQAWHKWEVTYISGTKLPYIIERTVTNSSL